MIDFKPTGVDKGRRYVRYHTSEEEFDKRTFTFSEVMDVGELIAHREWPNGQFGDDECSLWGEVTRKLGIRY